MARVKANVNEKIFNISLWRGVNEAPEGETRLRPGEAAQMRNFCVTSGGALKKRPGSKNVAGLTAAFWPRVREDSELALIHETGYAAEGHLMRPRMSTDDHGNVIAEGAAVKVTPETAEEYAGYYYEAGQGRVYRLCRCETKKGRGAEAVLGGMARPGELTEIASGVEWQTEDGERSYIGPQFLETYAQAATGGEDKIGVLGDAARREAPDGTSPGWDDLRNAGGYVLRGGVLYRYYGARVDGYASGRIWRKYSCKRNIKRRYYTESGFHVTSTGTDLANPSVSISGSRGYSFDSSSGIFSETGGQITIRGGEAGTVYSLDPDTKVMRRYDVRPVNETSSQYDLYYNYAGGPYTESSYERGDYIGEVFLKDREFPDQEAGYTFAGTTMIDGTLHLLTQLGEEYFCYTSAGTGQAYEKSYSFHGYPLTVEESSYTWYFNETYSIPNESTDTQVRGIWSGFVGGREVLCAACGGALWELFVEDGVWRKATAGRLDTSRDVHMFGFDEKLYILNGVKYYVWDGEILREVEGYRPLVCVTVEPTGGGTLLESVNRLTAGRRCWFSPDGSAVTFRLPETNIASVDWVRTVADGQDVPGVTADLEQGTVTFASAPEQGVNTIEVAWSAREDFRRDVSAMRFAELYNGAQDSRVFLYGDGSNRAFYSGLDYNGKPRADYFPDLHEVAVGDANTPITAMIRHYNKLMAFKPDSAWSIGYDTSTLVDGTVTAGFYVTPVNRAIGNCAYGQAQLVQNRPRTLDGRSVIEWRATNTSGNVTGDQRNAERVSQRVDNTIRKFDLSRARTFYDKFSHEYYVIGDDGTAIAQNMDLDAWYVYTGLDVTCMINYRDELYYGTRDGYLRHFSDKYFSDNGEAIDAYWESGAMSFSEDFRRKYSATVWIGIKPEDNGHLEVTAETDRKRDFAVYDVESVSARSVPEMERIKLKARKFTYYKLILRNNSADKTATVVSADMRVRGAGYVR